MFIQKNPDDFDSICLVTSSQPGLHCFCPCVRATSSAEDAVTVKAGCPGGSRPLQRRTSLSVLTFVFLCLWGLSHRRVVQAWPAAARQGKHRSTNAVPTGSRRGKKRCRGSISNKERWAPVTLAAAELQLVGLKKKIMRSVLIALVSCWIWFVCVSFILLLLRVQEDVAHLEAACFFALNLVCHWHLEKKDCTLTTPLFSSFDCQRKQRKHCSHFSVNRCCRLPWHQASVMRTCRLKPTLKSSGNNTTGDKFRGGQRESF